ncbi:MAG TPA: glycosyltransferase family 39 protein [Thermoanaerobaculia bacterium]|nr:glycosyltransferase family 39 protein [Thermoanaerobaculia bacterium]
MCAHKVTRTIRPAAAHSSRRSLDPAAWSVIPPPCSASPAHGRIDLECGRLQHLRENHIANTAWGLATVVAVLLLFWFAYRAQARQKWLPAAVAITLAAMALRLYAGSDLYLHAWDERYHALVAKNLMAHPLTPTLYERPALPYDFRDWHANHVWLHKPPLALWLGAGGMALLGVNEIALRLPGLLLSTLAVLLTFLIGSRLFDPRLGLLAAAFHAVNGYLLQLPGGRVPVDHIDNVLIFCVELGIFLAVVYAQRPRFWLLAAIGAAAGLAVLAKWLPGLLVYPVWVVLVWRREKPRAMLAHLAAMALATAAVVLPWQLHIRHAFARDAAWNDAYNLRHFTEPIDGLGGSPLFHLEQMPRYFGELIYIPLAFFLAALALRREPRRLAPVAAWLFLPYLIFSLAATKMGAYVMAAAPAVCLVEAWFWLRLLAWQPAARPARWLRCLRCLRWSLLALLLLLPLRYGVERLKLRPSYDRDPAWARTLRTLPRRVGAGPVVLFNLDRPVEAMFYTPYTAYEGLPQPAVAQRLLREGWRVVVFDDGKLPPALAATPGVERLPGAFPASPDNDGTGSRLR